MSTICLCMLVRDESQVVARALKSVIPLLDYWVVVDTGSTDGTQDIVRQCLADIPGELHERPWVNFAVNRSEALELARGKAKYALILDADEILEYAADFSAAELKSDCVKIKIFYEGLVYDTIRFLMNDKPWCYKSVVHNYPSCLEANSQLLLKPERVRVIHYHDGRRANDPKKIWRDIAMLTQALTDNPTDKRYTFYLAQSYREAGEHDLAIHYYTRRVQMGGWQEEQWYAKWQIAHLKMQRGDPMAEVIQAHLDAYEMRPWRLEPLFTLCYYLRRQDRPHLAYLFGKMGADIPIPEQDVLFVHREYYDYLLWDELALAAYHTGRFQDTIDISEKLLIEKKIPAAYVERITRNRTLALEHLSKANETRGSP